MCVARKLAPILRLGLPHLALATTTALYVPAQLPHPLPCYLMWAQAMEFHEFVTARTASALFSDTGVSSS